MTRCGSCVILLLAAGSSVAVAQSAPPAGADAAEAQPAPPADAAQRIALLATHTDGIDPVVARYVDSALLRGAAALGYVAVDPERVRAAQERDASGAPLAMAELWQLTHRLDADVGVSVLAGARGGLYTLQLRVASRDGRGPFLASGETSQFELEAAVERLLAQALAQRAESSASAFQAAAPEPGTGAGTGVGTGTGTGTGVGTGVGTGSGTGSGTGTGTGSGTAAPPTPAPASPSPQPQLRLALHNDLAFGLADDPFLNEVLGARADLRLDDALWLGVHVGYANLPGREGRVHGVLPYAQLEQRIALAAGRSLAIPLRLGLGYLLRNGGFLRLSSGLAIPLGARSELVLDLLAPAFWNTRDKTLFSLAAGAELNFEL